VRIKALVLEAIEQHATRDLPRECCGLLIGTASTIVEAVPCDNAAAEPLRRYEIAPEEYFGQIRRCRELADGLRVVGAYHSHPRSAPTPSATDLSESFSGFIYLIGGPADGSGRFTVRAYELQAGNLEPLPLVIDAEGADQ
jgi:proteasome lid subunit RPN8/RPN11